MKSFAFSAVMLAATVLYAGKVDMQKINEAKLFDGVEDTDRVYTEKILPGKIYYNLKGIEQFSFCNDIKIMFMTAFAVLGKEYKGDYNEDFKNQENSKKAEALKH